MTVVPEAKRKKRGVPDTYKINRLSLLLTLTAVLFFTGAVWVLARDGKLDGNTLDGSLGAAPGVGKLVTARGTVKLTLK